MALLQYKTFAGQIYPNSSLNSDSEHIFVIKTTTEEVKDYIALLQQNGFVSHSQRSIQSGIEDKENLFYSCYKDDRAIVLFYNYAYQTCSIIEQPFEKLPAPQNHVFNGNDKVALAQLQLKFGTSYVIKLKDNSFVIVDGGNYFEEDVQRLYDFLQSNSADGKIKIRTWFFSHPDSDHITLATEFIKKYSQQIMVESFCYQFPEFDKIKMLIPTDEVEKNVIELEKAIKTYCKDAKIITARTGQLYNYDGASVEILCSLDDAFPRIFPSPNELSLALKVNFEDGRRAILLTDCMMEACRQLAFTYGSYLKSDILQLAHHGLIGGDLYLYKNIDPDICLWDTSDARFTGESEKSYKWCLGEGGCDYNAWIRDEKIKKRKHYTNSKTNVIVF